MNSKERIARNLAAAWLATDWTHVRLVAEAQRILGPATRRSQSLLVRKLLAAVPEPYPPSPDWIVSLLLKAYGFRRAAARALKDPQAVPTVLQPAKFAAAERFAGLAIPHIATPGDLAKWLGISVEHLDWFADARHLNNKAAGGALQHYSYRFVPKKNGPPRLVEEPKPRLKEIQRRILHEILDKAPVHPCVHGFVKNRSVSSAAQVHAGEAVVAVFDLRDFFLCTSVGRVHSVFRSLGYPSAVAFLMTGLCLNCTPSWVFERLPSDKRHDWKTRALFAALHLPQGAPASPALANLAAWRLDRRLHGLAQSLGANYTRYADDLAFSGDTAFAARLDTLAAAVETIATGEGFALNSRKTRMMRRRGSQRLLGIVVNEHINVPREAYDELKAILHNCRQSGPETQNRANLPRFREHLDGRVAWVEAINPARGAKLRRAFQEIAWPPNEAGASNDPR
ncbi:MAG: reverse transcriptase family protein [Rhodomicrobium sp.]